MLEPTDHELLSQYARIRSETAFAALVNRHVNLVYSTGLRFTGDSHQAGEITQAVFIVLARKAGSISPRVLLTGWLYQTARLTSLKLRREHQRRQQREQQAYQESAMNTPDNGEVWKQIAPVLDEAMNALRIADRDAVLLRYFENKTFAEVGAALGLSEQAAQKRVARALEKLRGFFAKRAVTLTATLIAGAVSAKSVQAAPAGMAKTICVVAATKGAAATAPTITLVKGMLTAMAWNVCKIPFFALASALFSIGLSAIGSFLAVRATLSNSKTQRERVARVRFGWKISITTGLQAIVASAPLFINVAAHPVLFGLSIFVAIILGAPVYVGLVLLWSFRHKRELEKISAEPVGHLPVVDMK